MWTLLPTQSIFETPPHAYFRDYLMAISNPWQMDLPFKHLLKSEPWFIDRCSQYPNKYIFLLAKPEADLAKQPNNIMLLMQGLICKLRISDLISTKIRKVIMIIQAFVSQRKEPHKLWLQCADVNCSWFLWWIWSCKLVY